MKTKANNMRFPALKMALATGLMATSAMGLVVHASSHNEAPAISQLRQVDGTDFYMFRSYEPGREDYMTIMGNYYPLQQPYGAVVFFAMDEDAVYELHLDNDGDNVEDLTFQFDFNIELGGITVDAGGQQTEVALYSAGVIGPNREDNAALNLRETYTLTLIEGDRRRGKKTVLRDRETGSHIFQKPADYVGTDTFGGPGNYETYARDHVYEFDMPDCDMPGKVFVGQRKDPFNVNLGQAFDLLNFQTLNEDGSVTPFLPVGEANSDIGPDVTDDDNVTTLSVELPIACTTADGDPVVGGWTTASLPKARLLRNLSEKRKDPDFEAGRLVQVSRLGSPLVNELVIGLSDKDRFNNSEPKDDGQFANYVTNPAFPEIIESVFGGAGVVVPAPNLFPRTDLIATFLTGLTVPNTFNTAPQSGTALSEMMRLDTSVAATPFGMQNPLGVLDFEDLGEGVERPYLAADPAGYPNGRRPGDDVIDITLRAAMGTLISVGFFGEAEDAPAGLVPFVDGARRTSLEFLNEFPYFETPLPGDRDD